MIPIIIAKASDTVKIFKQQNNFEKIVSPESPEKVQYKQEKHFSQYGANANELYMTHPKAKQNKKNGATDIMKTKRPK
jgi:hypothetical protein